MNYHNQSMGAIVIALVLCLLVVTDTEGAETFEIRMYNKKQLGGRYFKIKVDQPCINLPHAWDKQVSSVDPLGCIILYAEQNCRGLRRRLERWSWGSANLKDISFDKMISSFSPCPIVKKIVIPTDDEL